MVVRCRACYGGLDGILPHHTSANYAELVGQLDQSITDREYPPMVWSHGEVVVDTVQICAAKLQAGSYAVWMGMYAPLTQMRAVVEAGHDRLLHNATVDAEPIPELEFDQTLGW